MRGIYEAMVGVWGASKTIPVETRLNWYKANPEADYVVKKNGVIVGHIAIRPLRSEIIQQIMSGEIKRKNLQAEDILPFTPNVPLECEVGLAVRAGVPNVEIYGMRLIAGAIDTVQEFARKGILIKRLYANSETPKGIELCQNLGFEDISSDAKSTPRRFLLDFETSRSPFVKKYQKLVSEHSKQVN